MSNSKPNYFVALPHCCLTANPPGQALVALLVFMVVAITITSAAVVITIVNSQGASFLYQGVTALDVAESGLENSLLRLLRNPNYSGETITLAGGSATSTVSGTTTKTITTTGTIGNFARQVQVVVVYNNNVMTIQSWKEMP